MKINFIGDSYAALTLKEGARLRGLNLTDDAQEADLVFISQDTPTDKFGNRDLTWIRAQCSRPTNCQTVVLTSQVPPGFCRSLPFTLFHQAETLRTTGDGLHRAVNPEMFIVGSATGKEPIPDAYQEYLDAFYCPVIRGTWEDAEFTKIAINMTLAAQVDNTNRLAQAAVRCGADWKKIAQILRHDSRIGRNAYLRPGDWKRSPHLLRDYVTLTEIMK